MFVVDVIDTPPQSSEVIDHPLAPDSTAPDIFTIGGTSVPETMPPPHNRDVLNNSYLNNAVEGRNKNSQHGVCLTLSDHDRLRIFIHEFIVRGLISWAERTMRTLNEQVGGADVSWLNQRP